MTKTYFYEHRTANDQGDESVRALRKDVRAAYQTVRNVTDAAVAEPGVKYQTTLKNEAKMKMLEGELLPDLEDVKSRIAPRLVNYERNEEILKEIPHERKEDLAIVYYCSLYERKPSAFVDDPGFYTAIIDYSDLTRWGITKEELKKIAYQEAMEHTPYTFELIQDVIGVPKGTDEEGAKGIYVLSNECALYGAATVLYPGVLAGVAKKLGEDFYMLPSSVHEMLIVPKSRVDNIGLLRSIVREINEYEMDAEDVLSDHIYDYSIEKDDFSLVKLF